MLGIDVEWGTGIWCLEQPAVGRRRCVCECMRAVAAHLSACILGCGPHRCAACVGASTNRTSSPHHCRPEQAKGKVRVVEQAHAHAHSHARMHARMLVTVLVTHACPRRSLLHTLACRFVHTHTHAHAHTCTRTSKHVHVAHNHGPLVRALHCACMHPASPICPHQRISWRVQPSGTGNGPPRC